MQLRNIDRATASASRRRIATIGRVIPVFVVLGLIWATGRTPNERLAAQTGPGVLDQNLSVRTIVSGLESPVTIAFLGPDDFLVTEKQSGRVKHVVKGSVVGTAIDLAVNNGSERGLLGIALHPDFASTKFVYLYWTCRAPANTDQTLPSQTECADVPQTGADTSALIETPLLGNRVDRFVWNGSTLTLGSQPHQAACVPVRRRPTVSRAAITTAA